MSGYWRTCDEDGVTRTHLSFNGDATICGHDLIEDENRLNFQAGLDASPPESRLLGAAASAASAAKPKPRLGCAGIIWRGDQVLLGRRDKEPNRGLWILPGGGVEFCESFAETLKRELAEEAGIGVEVEDVFKVYEMINPPSEHRVIVYLTGHHRSGEPSASSDLSDVRFFTKHELVAMSHQKLISPFVERVLREVQLL